MSLDAVMIRIRWPDTTIGQQTQALLDAKTKPRGSLGRLEALARRVATIRGVSLPAPPTAAVVVMAADHGVAAEGVSAYPVEVTVQMVANFARGGAAINVLAREAAARVIVIDMGTATPVDAPGVRAHRVRAGSRNLMREPAMTGDEVRAALGVGLRVVDELVATGIDCIALGDMGIGNTTAAAALTAAFTDASPAAVTGRGTGVDAATHDRKVRVVERALALHQTARTPLEILACLGGLELAGLAGVVLGAAAHAIPVVLDGFPTGAAALSAVRLAPAAVAYCIAGHRSVEPGHAILLDALGLSPLLDLELRLGEGTGAALALPLVTAAVRLLHGMATFDDAEVTDTGA